MQKTLHNLMKMDKTIAMYKKPNYHEKFSIQLLVFIILLSTGLVSNGYVMEETGLRQSFLHQRLAGRQRREVQRKFLDLLGLPHRPRARMNSIRKLRDNSGPLYMLGLYNMVTGFKNYEFHPHRLQRKRDSPFSRRLGEPNTETNSYPQDPDLWRSDPAWVRHNQALQVFTNEVGTLEYLSPQNRPSASAQDGLMFDDVRTMTSYDTIESNNVEKRLLGDADLVMSFMASNPYLNDEQEDVIRRRLKKHRSFYFDISKLDEENAMISSKFRIYKEISEPNLSNETFRISVYQAIDGGNGFDVALLESRRVMGRQEGWLVYDVTQSCNDWINNSDSNLGLHVTIETVHGRNVNLNKVGLVGHKRDGAKQAFMVSFFSQSATDLAHQLSRRRKRSAALNPESEEEDDFFEDEEEDDDEMETDSDSSEGDFEEDEPEDEFDVVEEKRSRTKRNKKRGPRGKKSRGKKKNRNQQQEFDDHTECHRKFLKVFFKDVGWEDWIIAPQAYEAYYCYGDCPFPLTPNLNATNHAIIKTLLNYLDPEKHPKSCCSPTKLEEIAVLYFDDTEKVTFKRYKDMKVTACGCA